MFRRKSEAADPSERALSRSTKVRASATAHGQVDDDRALMDVTNPGQKKDPALIPLPELQPHSKSVRKERRLIGGELKKRRERGRARTRDKEKSAIAKTTEKKAKSSKYKAGEKPTDGAKQSEEENQPGSKGSAKRTQRARRKAIRNAKIRGEIDKLYELIRQSTKHDEEEPSMRDIEKCLLRALPKRKESRRKQATKALQGSLKGVARRKVTVHIGSTSSDSLASERNQPLQKPQIARRLVESPYHPSEKKPSTFSFDRVASSQSANSSIRQDATFHEEQSSVNAFSLWDCVGNVAPSCHLEAQSVENVLSDARDAADTVDTDSMQGARLVDAGTPEQGALTEIATEAGNSQETKTKQHSPLFRKLLKGFRPAKSEPKVELPVATTEPLASTATEAIVTIDKTQPNEPMIPETTMLVSMSTPNEETPEACFRAVELAEDHTVSRPLSPCSSSCMEQEDATKTTKEPPNTPTLSSDKAESTSIFGFLDAFGDAFYRTVSHLEPYPVPSKPIPSIYDIMSDFTNTTDIASPVVSPRSERQCEDREGHEDARDMSCETRDPPSTTTVNDQNSDDFEVPPTFDIDDGVKNEPNHLSVAPSPGHSATNGVDDTAATLTKQEEGCFNSTFRESYVLGYLLGSLAVQGETKTSDTSAAEMGPQLQSIDEETELTEATPNDERPAVVDEMSCPIQIHEPTQAKDEHDIVDKTSPSRLGSNLTKKIFFGAGRAKRNETKAQSLAKKAKALKPWLKLSESKKLPSVSEEGHPATIESTVTQEANLAALDDAASKEDDIKSKLSYRSIVPMQRSWSTVSMCASPVPLEDVLRMVKTNEPPRLAKGFLTYVLATFAAQARVLDRDGLCKGYVRCLSEGQIETVRRIGPELPPANPVEPMAAPVTVPCSDELRKEIPESNPYELALAPTYYSLGCFRLNCSPCVHPEPDVVQMPDEDLEAIITSVESSLAQLKDPVDSGLAKLTDLPTKSSGLPMMSDISGSTDDSAYWSTEDDDEGDYSTESGSFISDSDDDEDDLSSEALSDAADWMEYLAGSFESSSISESSAFDRMASFDVTEWMLRE